MEQPAHAPHDLIARIERKQARIGIIGLGYVGLPLAQAFCRSGFRVTGFDIDESKVLTLTRGGRYIRHLNLDILKQAQQEGRFTPTTDFDELAEQDAILICVPTPLTPQREPDMRFVRDTAAAVGQRLKPGQLVVLESTTYPGTTDELLAAELSTGGLRPGLDFFLAFSPEREDPGNRDFETTQIPKLVDGIDCASGDVAEALYRAAIGTVVRVSSARVAEAAKLTENIFRSVNIALVNELKVVYDRMGIDIWEVLDAAETKPFGFMRFNPGPGWGGHCIALDPFYLAWKAREYGSPTRFIELAGEVNLAMPQYVLNKLQAALNDHGKPVKGSRILVLGVAYKRDVDDCRESPAFVLMERLRAMGADLVYHDPHVPLLPSTRQWPELAELQSVRLDDDELRRADAVLIITDHTAVDYGRVQRLAKLVVDTRRVLPGGDPGVYSA